MSAVRTFFGQRDNSASQNMSVANAPAFGPSTNLFRQGEIFDFFFYLSPHEEKFRDFDDANALLWSEKNMRFGDWESGENHDGSRIASFSFPPPEPLLANNSLYLHAYIVQSGKSHVPKQPNYGGREVRFLSICLHVNPKAKFSGCSRLVSPQQIQEEAL